MIAGITGIVQEKNEGNIVLQSGFFRIRIFSPRPVIESAILGKEMVLHTHLNVREDDLSLFGFSNKNQLRIFQHLISVSGIGPKIALEILSVGEEPIQQAISQGDADFLQSIKGIGKKTAQRAILELREKMENIPPLEGSSLTLHSKNALAHEEATDALIGLGWKKTDISNRLKKTPKELSTAEEIIKWFLTNA